MIFYIIDGQLLAMLALGKLGYRVKLPALSLDFIFAKVFQKKKTLRILKYAVKIFSYLNDGFTIHCKAIVIGVFFKSQ
jgi:hypothetical protein